MHPVIGAGLDMRHLGRAGAYPLTVDAHFASAALPLATLVFDVLARLSCHFREGLSDERHRARSIVAVLKDDRDISGEANGGKALVAHSTRRLGQRLPSHMQSESAPLAPQWNWGNYWRRTPFFWTSPS